jgi:hypothetical protein
MTKLPKAKTRFNLETEMASPVIRWLRRRGLTVKSEFYLPWGVCDLVGVKFDPAKARRRLSWGQTRAIGPQIRLQILSRIPESDSGRSTTLRRLERDFSGQLSPERLSKELDRLKRDKFVTNPKRDYFQKRNGWAPLHQDIVAVELKLQRVSEALSQAASNRAFASKSYVALPAALALRLAQSRRADLFGQRGIGLLAVWQHKCQELIRPSHKEAACHDLNQSHVVERFWRTRDS